MNNLYIFKVDKFGNIFRSRNLYNIENKMHSSGRIFSASEYVNFLNNEREDKYFLSYNNEDFFEKIAAKKNKSKNIDQSKLVRVDLKFEEFNLEKKYRIIRKKRFSDNLSKSNWMTKEEVKKILDVMKTENKKKSRNPYVAIVENAQSIYDYVYFGENIEEKEYLLNEKRKKTLNEKTNRIGEEVDKKFNANVIKKDFLLHVLNKISVVDNFKLIKNDNVCLIKTIIPMYDNNKLSIQEQEKLLKRVFPSINFKENTFENKEILHGNPDVNLVKKHKHNVIMSVIEKANILNIVPVSLHYSALDKALKNHKLDIIETTKIKSLLDRLISKVKQKEVQSSQNDTNKDINNPENIKGFLDKVGNRIFGNKVKQNGLKK